MRLRRPAARLSELAVTFVATLFLAYGIVTWWPSGEPLDVSPAWCRPKYTPFTDNPGGHPNPPSIERQGR